jgi:hypothetical protein
MPKLTELTESVISQALEFVYEKAICGFKGVDSATKLAESYKKSHPCDKSKQVDALIKWQIGKGATSGFVTGLGGLLTLPVAIPANITSVLFIQIRMIVAIAIIGGYDPRDDKIKSFVYSCLAGSAVKDVLKDAGIKIGQQLVLQKVIPAISYGMLVRINRTVGFRLIAKFGEKGFINLGKMVPLVGGIIGGAMDAVWVAGVGKVAKALFLDGGMAEGGIVESKEIDGVKVEILE